MKGQRLQYSPYSFLCDFCLVLEDTEIPLYLEGFFVLMVVADEE
jgi:galactose-1-phosphate uridylyltransferase